MMTDLQRKLDDFYKEIGRGDVREGLKIAKRQLVMNFLDAVIASPEADKELKEKAFLAKASYQFCENYEKNNGL